MHKTYLGSRLSGPSDVSTLQERLHVVQNSLCKAIRQHFASLFGGFQVEHAVTDGEEKHHTSSVNTGTAFQAWKSHDTMYFPNTPRDCHIYSTYIGVV